MNRAVRFIRYHAKDYHIDPDRIGITGASAGGHLSLMQGTAGDTGDKIRQGPGRPDLQPGAGGRLLLPADRFPQLRQAGRDRPGLRRPQGFKPPFDFHEHDPKTKTFVRITDVGKILEIGRQISPIYHASSDDPPTLIIHGDEDLLVPIQQAELILDKLKSAGVETKLVVKKGAAARLARLATRTWRSSPTGSTPT